MCTWVRIARECSECMDLIAWAPSTPCHEVVCEDWGFCFYRENVAIYDSIFALAVQHALTQDIDPGSLLPEPHLPAGRGGSGDDAARGRVCVALFFRGAHRHELDGIERTVDIHSVVLLSTGRFAFIGAFCPVDDLFGRAVFVHTRLCSASLSALLSGMQVLLDRFGPCPDSTSTGGSVVLLTAEMAEMLRRIERAQYRRIVWDGFTYTFVDFLGWYGSAAMECWSEAAAAEKRQRDAMLMRVFNTGLETLELAEPSTISFDCDASLREYIRRGNVEVFQKHMFAGMDQSSVV